MSYAKICPRRGTKTEWNTANPILMEGEIGVEFPDTGIGTGICKMKLGDGLSTWDDLEYSFDGAAASSIDGGTVTTSNLLRFRRGTTDEWELEDPILELGEPVYDITKESIKIGDGEHHFKDLDYIGADWEMEEDYDFGDIDEAPIVPGPDDKDYDFGDIDETN